MIIISIFLRPLSRWQICGHLFSIYCTWIGNKVAKPYWKFSWATNISSQNMAASKLDWVNSFSIQFTDGTVLRASFRWLEMINLREIDLKAVNFV